MTGSRPAVGTRNVHLPEQSDNGLFRRGRFETPHGSAFRTGDGCMAAFSRAAEAVAAAAEIQRPTLPRVITGWNLKLRCFSQ
jgi:hypothetical protein